MPVHGCPECGLIHFVEQERESTEVAVARINAEAQLAIAKLQARSDNHVAEVTSEAAVDVAEAQADAIAEALTEPQEEPVEEPVEESTPVVLNAPVIDSGNDIEEAPEPPKRDETENPEPAPKKRSFGLGAW